MRSEVGILVLVLAPGLRQDLIQDLCRDLCLDPSLRVRLRLRPRSGLAGGGHRGDNRIVSRHWKRAVNKQWSFAVWPRRQIAGHVSRK